MDVRTILVATDFSTSSAKALEWASIMAHDLHAHLIILHVEPGQPASRFGSVYAGIPDPGISELARELAAIKPSRSDTLFEHRIRVGDPATEILAEARERRVDAIVLGSHGRGRAIRLLLGSVAETVLSKAPCPVMICKDSVQPKPVEPVGGDG